MKVVIVGESASGLLAAWELARRGAAVSLFEEHNNLSQNADRRLLIVTSQLARVKLFYGYRFKGFAASPLDRPSNKTLSVRPRHTFILSESRNKKEGAKESQKDKGKNAHKNENENKNKDRNDLSVVIENLITGQEKVIEAHAVVGADGARSSVVHSLGLASPKLLYLVQAVIPLPSTPSPEVVKTWFLPEESPYFFWLIPESIERGVCGLIGEKREAAREALKRFLGRLLRLLAELTWRSPGLSVFLVKTYLKRTLSRYLSK